VPVIIAHLWGGGPFARDALKVYVNAVQTRRRELSNLYFDVAESALVAGGDKKTDAEIADAIRKIGVTHVLFGSDAVGESTLAPVKAAAQFRSDIPLTPAEFATIASNHLSFLPPVRIRQHRN
jgi:predicted TIM-barrel fold metal-dependent hydrolase